MFIAGGVEATGGRLDVERVTASLLIGAVIWSHLGIVFEILTETVAGRGPSSTTFMAPLPRAVHLLGMGAFAVLYGVLRTGALFAVVALFFGLGVPGADFGAALVLLAVASVFVGLLVFPGRRALRQAPRQAQAQRVATGGRRRPLRAVCPPAGRGIEPPEPSGSEGRMPEQVTPGRTAERRTLPTEDDEARTQRVEVETLQDGRVEVSEPDRSRGAILREVIPELVFLAGAVYLFVMAGDFSARQQPGQLGPAFWPRLAAIGLAVGLLVRIVQVFREHNRPVVRVVSEFDDVEGEDAPVHWPSAALAMGLAFGYVIATMFLGWMLATMTFLTAFAWLGGQRRWAAPVVGVVGGLVLTYVFVGVVYVAVPTGVSVFDSITIAVYRLLGIQ